MSLSDVLALLVVFVATPLVWIVWFLCAILSRRRPDLRVLRERAVTAFALALLVTVFAVVFVNNDQEVPPLNPEQTRILTRGSLLVLATMSSAYWLVLYRRRLP